MGVRTNGESDNQAEIARIKQEHPVGIEFFSDGRNGHLIAGWVSRDPQGTILYLDSRSHPPVDLTAVLNKTHAPDKL